MARKYTKDQFFHRLEDFSDDELLKLTRRYVFLSREAADRPRSFFHQYVNKIYGEWERRGRVDLYEAAAKVIKDW